MLVLIATAGVSQATVTVNRSGANPQETTAIAAYATYGDDMIGMLVTANDTDTQIWGALTGTYGVQGNGWSLTESGHTFSSNWTTLTTTAGLDSLFIDAGPGDTIFDTLNGQDYTPGSADGREFDLTSLTNYNGHIDVTYSGPVSLSGQAFQGDLYRYMLIEFSETFTGSLGFRADTDNAAFSGDITPTVPAPGALVLAGLGTSLAGVLRRRRSV